jgi:hypothetical protein
LISLDTPIYASGMRIAPAWPKALALCSTLALASCYVWWSQDRASARREKEAAGQTQVLPGSKSFVYSGEPAGDEYRARSVGGKPAKSSGQDKRTNADFIADPEPKKERTMLPSSKIGLVSPPQQEANEETKKERTMLPGSKSAAFGHANRDSIDRILNGQETANEKEKEEPEKKRTVLPGSKSIDPILSPER